MPRATEGDGSTRRLHVVAHNGSGTLGGGELGTALLLAGLRRRGHRVLMLCRDRTMADRLAGYGVPTGVRHIGGDLALHDALGFALTLHRLRPDALILTTFKKVVLAGLGGRIAGVPFVAQRIVLEGDDPSRGARYRFALRHLVDRVVLNADSMRPPFVGPGAGLRPERVVTVHDGVDAPRVDAGGASVRRALGIPPDAVVVGSVGRLARQKRFDRLLRAVGSLDAPVHVLVAGEGDRREELEALAAELGLAGRVHLPGFRPDVGDVLDALDVYAVSSDREGMSNAMLEAMASGLPVVSTDVSGAREALDPADAGADDPRGDGTPAGLVVPGSADAVAGALARLVGDADLRERAGRAAARRADRSFGRERFLDEWEALLVEGVARAGRDGADRDEAGSA